MSNMIAYERYYGGITRLYLTGLCKKKTIKYSNGKSVELHYVQNRVHLFGIPLWTRWVDKNDVIWRSVTEEIYDCNFSG